MRARRRALAVALLALAVLAGVASPASAAPDGTATANASVDAQESPVIETTQTFSLAPTRPGWVTVEREITVPDNVRSLTTTVPEGSRVLSFSGATQQTAREYRWTGERRRLTVTYRLPVNESVGDGGFEGGAGARTAVDAGDWALFTRPTVQTRWNYIGATPSIDRSATTDGPGEAGRWLVFLGEHRLHTRQAAGQRIRLVQPRAANMTASPTAVLDSLEYAARNLDVGARDDEVLVIAAPTEDVEWGEIRGLQRGERDFWVRADEPVASPENAWVHEYVHTRQSFRTGPGVTWFEEASASYYAATLTFGAGDIRYPAYRAHLAQGTNATYDDVVLSNRSTWRSRAPYERGALAAGVIDRRIRLATGGNATLEAVFRRMNQRGAPTDQDAFLRFVAEASDGGATATARRAVTTPATLSTWNASEHRAAFGPFPARLSYDLTATRTYGVTGPYRDGRLGSDRPLRLVPGERLVVDARVSNDGARPGEYSVPLRVNGTVVDRTAGTLPANDSVRVPVVHQFEGTGRYTVSVNGASVPVRVVEPFRAQLLHYVPASSRVRIGEAVAVEVVLRNRVEFPAERRLNVTVDGERVMTRTVPVAPDEVARTTIHVPIRQPGESTIRIDGGRNVTVVGERPEVLTPPTTAGGAPSTPTDTPTLTPTDRTPAERHPPTATPVGDGTTALGLMALLVAGVIVATRFAGR